MEIREIKVLGFGPLADETLRLAPGMTVVYGPNESAKTSLHAATYAAICGLRRGRGQPKKEDVQFAARHSPWNGAPWKVVARVVLAGGREIELAHDLAGGVDCRATDVGLGRDVSAEIMSDGAPDGSRWLGFDRVSFVATACVRQAEIAAILSQADALQDELQRAAASAGRDETAAEAIQRLRSFFSEQVGLDRANSRRPLRRSMVGVENGEASLEEAMRRHETYLSELSRLDELEREREEAAMNLRLAQAVSAGGLAAERTRQFERAEELAARHPEEPSAAAGEEELANAIAEALTLWSTAPREPDLSGLPIADIENAIAALPERPDGDLIPAQAVLDADAALTAAGDLIEQHNRTEPTPSPVGASAEELNDLADRLAEVPRVDDRIRERVGELRTSLSKPAQAKRAPLAFALLLASGGVVLAIAASVVVGVLVVFAAIIVALVILWMARQRPDAAAQDALSAAESILEEQEVAVSAISARREEAEERISELGLEPDPRAIRTAARQGVERRSWEQQRAELVERRQRAAETLQGELEARDIVIDGGDLHAAVASYKQACHDREDQNRVALRRPALEQQLQGRRAAEADVAARADAREKLTTVAARIGSGETDPGRIASALREWQETRSSELDLNQTAHKEWKELQLLLDGGSLDELRTDAEEATRAAAEAAEGLDRALVGSRDPKVERARIPQLQEEFTTSSRLADHAKGQLEEMAKELPSVPEAEEKLEAARAELERVRGLESTLNLAIKFLEEAQERVFRTIAPVLCKTLESWLPRVAIERQGDRIVERYDQVMVDPETLNVKVRLGDNPWRDASHLSEGTKEQIYLLLRVALAEHLTTPGEKAPLILDEITAQCDSHRRAALLGLLHDLSSDRQIILFTHDEGALAWAEESLDLEGERDRLDVRTPVPVA